MAHVEGGEVEEVEDEHDLGPDELGAGKEHDEGEVEEVVQDEVASDGRGGMLYVGVLGEEVADVASLHDPEKDPRRRMRGQRPSVGDAEGGRAPVDVGDDGVEAEGGGVAGILAPDGPGALAGDIVGGVEGVVPGDDDGEDPAQGGENLVGGDGAGAVAVALPEGVVCGAASTGGRERERGPRLTVTPGGHGERERRRGAGRGEARRFAVQVRVGRG